LFTELSVVNIEWQYAGTIDVVEELPDGTRRIVDYKTGKSGIYKDRSYQLTPYRHATHYLDPETKQLAPMESLGITSTWGVWLRSDGYSAYPFRSDEYVFQRFCYLLSLWRAQEYELDDWKGDAADPPKWD